MLQNDKFTEEQMHNYRMAVTEREVRNGCITMPDDYVKDHVIIYTRILRNINLQNLKRASAFIGNQSLLTAAGSGRGFWFRLCLISKCHTSGP